MSGFYALPTAVQIAIFTTIVSVATTIGTVLWNYATQQEMERFKARIAQAASLDNAKLEYEFDARKRLYARIAPLLFQLAEAAEGSYYRIVNLVGMRSAQKVERLAKKALLDVDGSLVRTNYYLTSTLYKIFLPFALYRLLQRSATSFDLTLDSEIRAKYFLLKTAFICFTDDHELSAEEPRLGYTPNVADWKARREIEPALCWRQGLVTGHLEQLCDAMIVGAGDQQRPMTYGEFEKAAFTDQSFQKILDPPADLFIGFNVDTRPVFARVILAQAAIMRLLFRKFPQSPNPEELVRRPNAFAGSDAAQADLQWWDTDESNWVPVLAYLTAQINWIFPDGAAQDP